MLCRLALMRWGVSGTIEYAVGVLRGRGDRLRPHRLRCDEKRAQSGALELIQRDGRFALRESGTREPEPSANSSGAD